jgi:four helix bundle protein
MGKGLDELEVLGEAQRIADEVWARVISWDGLPREVVGLLLARAVDSVGANIAEAFGRFHYADKVRFLYYARGSLFETLYWIGRAKSRGLLPEEEVEDLDERLNHVGRQLNAFIRSLKSQGRSLRDAPAEPYLPGEIPSIRAIIPDEDIDPATEGRQQSLISDL